MNSNDQEFYLLLKDTVTVPINRSRRRMDSGSSNGLVQAIKGSLIKRANTVNEFGDALYIYIDDPNQRLLVQQDYLRPLTEQQFETLYAIQSKNDRLNFYEGELFLKVMDVKLKDKVKVKAEDGLEYVGSVKFCGIVIGENGKQFGIEFQKPVGNMNGNINGIQYFKCVKKYGMVVPADKITEVLSSKRNKDIVNVENVGIEPDKPESCAKFGNCTQGKKLFPCKYDKGIIVKVQGLIDERSYQSQGGDKKKKDEQQMELTVDTMVSFEVPIIQRRDSKKTKTRHGVVRWVGYHPGIADKLVGLELEEYGQCDGEFKGKRYFNCPQMKGTFIKAKKCRPDERFVDDDKGFGHGVVDQGFEHDVLDQALGHSNVMASPPELQPQEVSLDNITSTPHLRTYEENDSDIKKKDVQPGDIKKKDVQPGDIKKDVQPGDIKKKDVQSGDNKKDVQPDDMKKKNVHPGDNKKKEMNLSVGTVVEVIITACSNEIKLKTCYGVVRWVGYHPDITDKLVGLELEDFDGRCDGTFNGTRYFTCQDFKGFFIKAKACRPDERFVDNGKGIGDGVVDQGFGHGVVDQELEHGVVDQGYELTQTDPLPDYKNYDGWMPDPLEYKENVLPPDELNINFLGKKKGIQGHHNSCYMDATLFAMFSYAYVFDVALHRKRRVYDMKDYDKVQRILKGRIVNPLRKIGFVHRDNVMHLRKCLNEHTNMGGFMIDEKDPGEFTILLFEKILRLEPFITLKQNGDDIENTAFLYQLFPRVIEHTKFPSIQSLLELSLVNSDLRLKESPSVMILQVPRIGQQKMFERIFISPTLDVTPILYTITLPCEKCCYRSSMFHCPQCACSTFGREKVMIYLCEECEEMLHMHPKRNDHKPHRLGQADLCTDKHKQRNILELFAVVSVHTSHHVAFVKCGEDDDADWVCFDSMADCQGGDQDGYQIPEVTKLDRLKEFLYGEPWKVGIELSTIKAAGQKDKQDKMILRFYEDANLCFYRNKRFSMYR